MASDLLAQVSSLVELDVPDTVEVTDKLIQFADALAEAGPEEREIALGEGAYWTVCRAWTQCCSSGFENVLSPGSGVTQCRDAVLRALYALTAGNPDIIDEIGWQILTQAIKKTVSEEAQILALRVLRNVFIKSEENREIFTLNLGLVETLVAIIIRDKPTNILVQEWSSTMKALTLSDDIRVAYNRAPERKRVIHRTKVLPVIADLLNQTEYKDDDGTMNAMVVFLGTIAMNEDTCLSMESGNVLPGAHFILERHFTDINRRNRVPVGQVFKSVCNRCCFTTSSCGDPRLAPLTLLRNTISLLRYLCVDETVREKAKSFNFLELVMEAITLYRLETELVDIAISCCSMMTLKHPFHVTQFVANNGLEMLYQIMGMPEYKEDVTVLKGCCFTLRNVCENGSADAKFKINEMGFPTILSEILTNAPVLLYLKEFYVMPILRELARSEDETSSLKDSGDEKDATETYDDDGEDESETGSHPEEQVSTIFGEAAEDNI